MGHCTMWCMTLKPLNVVRNKSAQCMIMRRKHCLSASTILQCWRAEKYACPLAQTCRCKQAKLYLCLKVNVIHIKTVITIESLHNTLAMAVGIMSFLFRSTNPWISIYPIKVHLFHYTSKTCGEACSHQAFAKISLVLTWLHRDRSTALNSL